MDDPHRKEKIVLRTQKVHKFYFSSFFFSTLLDASNSSRTTTTKYNIINSECGNSKLIRHKEGKWEWECLTAFYCYLLCYPFFTQLVMIDFLCFMFCCCSWNDSYYSCEKMEQDGCWVIKVHIYELL